MIKENSELVAVCEDNKKSWDSLYATTREYIWGHSPIGFLDKITQVVREYTPANPRILDAGAGEGRNLEYLLNLSDTISACDSSVNALEKIAPGLKSKLSLYDCDLVATPFTQNHFDLVLLADVIETLPNPLEVLEEMYRILNTSGHLICNVPGKNDHIFDSTMKPFDGDDSYLYQDKFFYHFYSRYDAMKLLESAGFNIVYAEEHSWEEAPHPKFREASHSHCSLVIIAKKDADVSLTL